LKLVVSILIILLSFETSYGQRDRQQIDSLKQLITQNKEKAREVDLLNEIADVYAVMPGRKRKDSSLVYSNKAVELATAIKYKKGKAQGLYDIGKYHVGVAANQAISTKFLLESLEVYTEIEDKKGIAKCHMQLGLVSYTLQYFDDAIRNLELSLLANEEPTTKYLLALSYIEQDSFKLARKWFSESIKDYTERNDVERLEECYLYLGKLYLKTGDLDSCFFYINKTISSRTVERELKSLIRPYAFISEAYFESNKIDSAIHFAQLSYDLEISESNEIDDQISLIQASRILSKAYALKGNFKKAYFYLDVYNTNSNSYTEGSTKQKVADMQSMYEFDQQMSNQKAQEALKEAIANQELKRTRNTSNFLLTAFVFVFILAFVFFKQRNKIKLEKQRSEKLLLNILPKSVAEELKEKGFVEAQEFHQATVLFSDFKGFTQMTFQLNATDLVAELNTCFSAFDAIIEKHKLEKIKTIGDSYMASGGIGTPRTSNPRDVVLAGIEMQDFIKERKSQRNKLALSAFEMRVGIHTGPVIAGIVGVKKFQYDIWGDTVNTASRIESSGEVDKVNISQATYKLLKDDNDFIFENRGKIEAKGKGEIAMWFVALNLNATIIGSDH
jgi:adenylate cyclase